MILPRPELDYELSELDACKLEFENFSKIFNDVFNKHAFIKKQLFWKANQKEFMTKKIKAVMTRSRLSNKYWKRKVLTQKSHMVNKEIIV